MIRKRFVLLGLILAMILFVGGLFFASSAPKDFGENRIITIPKGFGSFATAKLLKSNDLVRSSILLHFIFIISDGESRIQAGDYLFRRPLNAFELSRRIISGEYGFAARRVTLPEGLSAEEMAVVLDRELINFDPIEFNSFAKEKEGYLFPDTYLISPMATSGEVINLLTETFEERLETISQEVAAFNKPLNDIIIMASIVEEEANDEESRRIVAGILWDRLKNNMPLQVDATFKYIIGKTSAELTMDDLRIDSPYNTYRYKGLPPTPIASPGLESILATVKPIDTPYVYFLTGDDGKMYYAKTLDEHNKNKAKHIKENE